MASIERHGTIIGKVLIVVFFVGLLFSIFYPKKIWDETQKKLEESRTRMSTIWTAETFFKNKTKKYTDNLSILLQTLKQDSSYRFLQDSMLTIPLDSILFDPINGQPYKITLQDSTPIITIESPVVPSKERVLGIFPREIQNPGSISDGKATWEK